MKRLIIVPTKNEESSIVGTLKQLEDFDVVICDGGSTDRTLELAKGVEILNCESGYGKVILEGFRHGVENGYDQMIVIDCESHTFAEIVPFLDCGADVIAGLRKDEKKPWYRKVITRVGRRMMPSGVKTEIVDISNGFRAYSRQFVEFLLSLKDMDKIPSYTFNSIVAFYSNGWKVKQFPMTYIGGKSGLNIRELAKAWSFRSNYEMQVPPFDWSRVTTEDIASFLKMYYGPTFESYCRKRHND